MMLRIIGLMYYSSPLTMLKRNPFCLCASVSLWLMTYGLSFAAEHRDVGLTQKGNRIEASTVLGASETAPTVLLIGGLAGDDETSRMVNQEIRAFEALPQNRRSFRLIAIA